MAMSDKELVKRCQADSAAFEELLRRHRRAIFAYAMASTGSRQDAEEITQDVFVKVYRAAHRFDSRYSFTTWLYAIASNTCKNKFRSRRKRTVSLDGEAIAVVPISHEADPLEAYRKNVEVSEVRNAIDELPPRYRQVLYLRYVEALSLSLGNVEARIFRGKEKVRQKLLKRSGKNQSNWHASSGEQ